MFCADTLGVIPSAYQAKQPVIFSGVNRLNHSCSGTTFVASNGGRTFGYEPKPVLGRHTCAFGAAHAVLKLPNVTAVAAVS